MSSLIQISKINIQFLKSRRQSLPPIPSSSPKTPKFNVIRRTAITNPSNSSITGTSEGWSILCEPCNGSGWIICDFCNGQKTNVPADNKRIHRRCPSCRAIGVILCSKCLVYKCVTFPDHSDSGEAPPGPKMGNRLRGAG